METTENVFSKMLRVQIIATLAVAIIAGLISGLHAAISALAGGGAVIISAFIASKVAERSANKQDASAILINLLKAEAIKIICILILLLVTFKMYKQLVPFALIAGLAAAALFSGAALSKFKENI